jgi:hypothetical protein
LSLDLRCGKARNNPADSNHARESRTVCQSQHTMPSAIMLAVTDMGRCSSLDLGPSRMAGSFAARVVSRHGVAAVDVLIARYRSPA